MDPRNASSYLQKIGLGKEPVAVLVLERDSALFALFGLALSEPETRSPTGPE